jgi:hypothetical protein
MEKGVEGRYVSIEQLKELENGSTQWLMVTAGSAGGMIPGFLVEASMDSKIAEVGQFLHPICCCSQVLQDVPHFIHWLQSKRKQSDSAAAPATT